jgi:hypothetical protein
MSSRSGVYPSYRTGRSPIPAPTRDMTKSEAHQRILVALEKELAAVKSARYSQNTQSRLLTPIRRPASRAPVGDYMRARDGLLDQRGRLQSAFQEIYRNPNGSYNRAAVKKVMGDYDDTLPAKHRAARVDMYTGIIEEEKGQYGGYAKALKTVKTGKPTKRKVKKSTKPPAIRRRKPTLVRK